MTVHPIWDTADEFYAADERREHSRELKLPGRWYGEGWDERYDLYWLEQTGEIVAICQGEVTGHPPGPTGSTRPVELIGWAESHPLAVRTLSGWASHHMELKSLYWLRRQVRLPDRPAVPGDMVTARHRDQAAASRGSLF